MSQDETRTEKKNNPMNNRFSNVPCALVATAFLATMLSPPTVSAETFFWKLPADQTGDFADPANWSTNAVDGPSCGRAPGVGDTLADGQDFRFDLGGKRHEIAVWHQSVWTPCNLAITNGTLVIKRSSVLHSGLLDIQSGATLVIDSGANFHPGMNDAGTRRIRVADGGRLVFQDADFRIYHMRLVIEEGGAVDANARSFHVTGSQKDSQLRNEGALSLPAGMPFSGDRWGGCFTLVNAATGHLSLGGPISEGGHRISVGVRIEGGEMDIRDGASVAFDVASAEFTEGSSTTVRLGDGATADFSAFSFGAGATVRLALAKTDGKARVLLDAVPDNLSVEDGIEVLRVEDLYRKAMTVPPPAGEATRILHRAPVPVREALRLPLAEGAIDENDRKRGFVRLNLEAQRGGAPWRIDPATNRVWLAVGEHRLPVRDKTAAASVAAGGPVSLVFDLPSEHEVQSPKSEVALLLDGGILASGKSVLATVSKGIARPVFHIEADRANRNYYIDASALGDDAKSITYTVPNPGAGFPGDADTIVAATPLFRHRFPEGIEGPFTVRARVETWTGGHFETNLVVSPNPEPLRRPAPNEDVLVGICVYGDAKQITAEIITNHLCNLLVQWSRDSNILPENLPPGTFEQAKRDGLRTMTIYGGQSQHARALAEAWGDAYLGNNIGEYAGYLYQWPETAKHIPQNHDVIQAKERFINDFIYRGPVARRGDYPFIFSTSGSPLATYELRGGIDYICNELFAVGSANLAYASSEARGAARMWKPEYWCSWLAEDWQTFGIPYLAQQKYDLLYAALLQQYVMGTSMTVLESGAQNPQATEYTDWGDGTERRKMTYDDIPSQNYRKTMKKFYDFVRENPRDKGTPDTSIAFALGNGDAFVGMTHDSFAVWGQHEQAATNSNWRCGLPEQTWNRVKQTFFPCPGEALRPYPNHWLAGSPYGQCDVVNIDGETRLSDLSRYKLLTMAGWNTMVPQSRRVLEKYAEEGGLLVICVPHFSTRRDREYRAYTPEDLMPLLGGARVTGAPVEITGEIEFASDALGEEGRTFWQRTGKEPRTATLRLAPLELPKGATVLATIGGKPLVVRLPVGKGFVVLMAGWDYPGNKGALSDLYAAFTADLAAAVPQRVTILPLGDHGATDDRRYVCYAAYGKTAYVLNLDCIGSRTVLVRLPDGKDKVLELAPLELRILPL